MSWKDSQVNVPDEVWKQVMEKHERDMKDPTYEPCCNENIPCSCNTFSPNMASPDDVRNFINSRKNIMDPKQLEMYELSFKRPSNYFKLSQEEQWQIDKRLNILDWSGAGLDDEQLERFKNHYE